MLLPLALPLPLPLRLPHKIYADRLKICATIENEQAIVDLGSELISNCMNIEAIDRELRLRIQSQFENKQQRIINSK